MADSTLSPLWWDSVPDKPTPEYEALTQLLYDGEPIEIAENFREQGNEAVKRGKQWYKDAVVFYTKAIEQNVPDQEKASIYYSNRAAVNLLLENFGLCIEDSLKSVEINPKNIKGYWRAARAYNKLGKLAECIAVCDRGLEQEPGNKEIEAEKKQATEKLEAAKKKIEEERRREAEQAESKRELYSLLEQNQMVMGEKLFDLAHYPTDIFPDENNQLHFPVLFIYEETSQTDFVQDFPENDTFADHLAEMFPAGTFLEWDTEKKYKQQDLEIYFETNWSKPVSKPRPNAPKERKLVKVRQTTTLRKVLQHEGYIIPQIPAFYILVANSPFKNKFLQGFK
eukprot:Phypoly_transcript_01326.p2 GENE.Phypoly_transcript_01326~~Phypoly_transcript_01326.p2  ORF type:complete len:339 (+),score=57.25 Phypoly_transcript_01326:2158-3174(+)